MAQIHIIREERFDGSSVTLDIFVDGTSVVSLENGKSASIHVAGGRHALQARYDQWFNNPVPKYGGGTTHSKGESAVLNIDLVGDVTLRCGFKGGLAGFFSSGPFLRVE